MADTPKRKRGRPVGSGLRPASEHSLGRLDVKVRFPSREIMDQLAEQARAEGQPDDGRAGGRPALGPWLFQLGLERLESGPLEHGPTARRIAQLESEIESLKAKLQAARQALR